jgi:hypothetical protein
MTPSLSEWITRAYSMASQWRFPSLAAHSRLMQKLLASIKRFNRWHAAVFILFSFGFGQAINRHAPLGNFLAYQLLFIPAVVIALLEIRRFLTGLEEYLTLTASHPDRAAGAFVSNLLKSWWTIPGVATVSLLYIYATLSLRYIEMNSVGYYALLMIILVMLSATLGQTCYVYYLLFLRRLAGGMRFRYNFYFPARTDWVQLLAQMGNRLSNAFFILGFIYTTVYFLNVPDGYIRVSLSPWRLELATPNDEIFLVTWVVIFLIIVLAFPVYAWLKTRYLKLIVRRLKDISLGELDLLVAEGSLRSRGDLDAELKCYQLMEHINDSADSPYERLNLLPIVATLSSVSVHLIKISESFLQ